MDGSMAVFLAAAAGIFMVCTLFYLVLQSVGNSMTRRKRRNIPGRQGEYETTRQWKRVSFYHRIRNNCYIPQESGGTTEIDIIVVSVKGIYVIENKDYSGWIYGKEKEKYWYEVFPGKRVSFYNPIWQNSSHIRSLSRALGMNRGDFHSVICFNDRAVLKKIRADKKQTVICNTRKLKRILRRQGRKPERFTREEVDLICEEIDNLSLSSKRIQKRHKREVAGYQ